MIHAFITTCICSSIELGEEVLFLVHFKDYAVCNNADMCSLGGAEKELGLLVLQEF